MAGSWGGYGFSAIFRVLCIILTNTFGRSFLEVLPRGVFKDILVSLLKIFLELSKLQKCRVLHFVLCFYKVSESSIYLWREYQNKKSPSAYVCANENCFRCHAIMLFVSASTYGHEEVFTNLLWHCYCSRKLLAAPKVISSHSQNSNFLFHFEPFWF